MLKSWWSLEGNVNIYEKVNSSYHEKCWLFAKYIMEICLNIVTLYNCNKNVTNTWHGGQKIIIAPLQLSFSFSSFSCLLSQLTWILFKSKMKTIPLLNLTIYRIKAKIQKSNAKLTFFLHKILQHNRLKQTCNKLQRRSTKTKPQQRDRSDKYFV